MQQSRTRWKTNYLKNCRWDIDIDTLPADRLWDKFRNELIYDVCGYLFHTRDHLIVCKECHASVIANNGDLPDYFIAKEYTVFLTRGGLLFATIPVYKTIREVETVVASHLDYEKQYLIGDSYDVCRKKIRKLALSSLFCDGHFKEFYFLIMEYIKFRYHFASKRFKNRVLSKADSTVKSKFKLGKLGRLNKI